MQDFRADRASLCLLQIVICLLAAVIDTAAALFLDHWTLLMWIVIAVIAGVAILVSFVLLPLSFRRLVCTVTATQITVCTGILFRKEQSVRMDAIQFVQLISGPFDGALGLNFVILHVYGGQLLILFLNRNDRNTLTAFLQQKGVFYAT